MIEVEQLRKSYGDLNAVDGVSFTAQPGQIFGLLGPNGAGKTTTIGCISGLVTPTAGHVRVLGHDVVREGTAARKALGVVPQEIALYEDLSSLENLACCGVRWTSTIWSSSGAFATQPRRARPWREWAERPCSRPTKGRSCCRWPAHRASSRRFSRRSQPQGPKFAARC